MPFLEIDNLRKRFAGTEVLKGIDLDLEQGGFLVLVGPSGCGKSTLLNSIAGLEPVTAGEIRLNGRVINDLHPSKRDIAMVFQSYALYPNMNVAQNMGFGLEMRKIARPERERAVADVAKMLQIEHLLTRKPSQLSGGQRQRVAMGRALVRQPQVFLFDEPLSNLDAKLRVDMRTEIKRLHQSVGATIVYVTHDQIEAMTLATKIAVLKDGAIQQVGTPAEIYNRPANLFVADFMGSPAMNLMKATVTASPAGPALSLERPEDDPHIVPLSPELGRAAGDPGRTVILGIRPEAIADRDAADRNGRSVAFLDCRIEVVEPAGSDTYIVTRLGGVEVIARVRAEVEMRPGDVVPLAFNLDKAVLFDPETEVRL